MLNPLYELRVREKMSQRELAQAIDIHYITIQGIEHWRGHTIQPKVLGKICEYFKIDAEEFLRAYVTGREQQQNISTIVKKTVDLKEFDQCEDTI